MTVYARTLLQTPDWFLQFCEATGPQLAHLASTTGEQLLLGFLDRWLDKFDAIGTPAARKLSALALCNVLTLPVPSLLQRLDPIAAHLTAVWFEVHPPPSILPSTLSYPNKTSNAHSRQHRSIALAAICAMLVVQKALPWSVQYYDALISYK